MDINPLAPDILFHIGPVPIDRAVVTTWAIMALLTLLSWLGTRRATVHAGGLQAVLEIAVEALETQIRDVLRRDPWPYLPILGSLFLFIVVANLSAVIPGLKPPTAHLETPAALAIIVFLSAHAFGLRSLGPVNYLKRYVKPNPILLPLNILAEFTRTFSLMIRLFGNMMSHEFVLAIVVFLAGLLLPVPFMLLGILIGVIQAYIFTILATVFIGAAVSGEAD
ncbi:F0F1 ATP synthase subunit A [Rhodospirillaceae bacterium KN72]|uniref:ATP synthase subunit a n=1 Tax=Pacificispira spongiicola TaxID=2729598 RepID=A0A7Y0E3F8_9PROT|nr:F0F1 ATP synthase subunit A [Pacificispira spongiicola]NMM46547.1 F0F1 ATP synthase subunit A [Pacificispira spongiicola]